MALPLEAHGTIEHPDIGWVHGGIFAVHMSVWPEMIAAIKTDVSAGLKIALTGHSLGAGCTVLGVGMLVALGIVPVRWAAFAPPRVGFKQLIELVAKSVGTGYRNSNDPVPEVPIRALPLWLYEQVPLLLGGPPPYRPPWNAHHIENYIALEASLNGVV